ncbi:class I SAM-dependent methyltransferase [Aquabacterium sp.]|uniref:class I SAM-dependent methyltransferase n=1 Tax=Aquabacterium sp. TaxID=1872578 RepID=UPI002B8E2C32|nr:class I SAM-dependent methyltransferase [Aquabacterium sp.]HSW08967.1 class I SAM-dependent methyltransferase [Aquabacterium sp.]
MLLSKDTRFEAAADIVDVYETIYTQHTGVWVNQGRSPAFIAYFAGLVRRHAPRRLLEIGCGEGVLLAALQAGERHGTELAVQALERARSHNSDAQLCIALGEELPFADAYFDVIASVGVMEHFIDDRAATREIYRALEPGGRYLVLIHVHLTAWQSLQQKIAEYVFPRPRPLRLMRWLAGKIFRPIHQPVQNGYSVASAQRCLEECGFVVDELIHKANTPAAPLIGPHVVIYVCRKPAP